MDSTDEPTWLDLSTERPQVHEPASVAPNATLIVGVTVAEGASIWYTAVLGADGDRIDIGADRNIQDGSVLHTDPGYPLTIGRGAFVGHRVVLHCCRIDDNVLVGMGAVVMNGGHVGKGSVSCRTGPPPSAPSTGKHTA